MLRLNERSGETIGARDLLRFDLVRALSVAVGLAVIQGCRMAGRDLPGVPLEFGTG